MSSSEKWFYAVWFGVMIVVGVTLVLIYGYVCEVFDLNPSDNFAGAYGIFSGMVGIIVGVLVANRVTKDMP